MIPARAAALRQDLFVATAALLALLAWDMSGLDLAAAQLFGSATGFAWRDHWLLRQVLHDDARVLSWCLAALLLLNLPGFVGHALSFRERLWWLLATLACAAVPALIKQASLTSCAWDLVEFGGAARHVSHWRIGVADGGAGHCFPSGHASTAFAHLSSWFVLRHAYPRLARQVLVVVLGAGVLLAAVQLARGAHYPSHSLWTAWLSWTLCSALAPLLAGRSPRGAPVPVQP